MTALRTTVAALPHVPADGRAAAWRQVAVLLDDHFLPTHDELAWRAAVRAFRLDPDSPLHTQEGVRRTCWRSPYAQLPRSLGNVFLYAALVVREGGRRVPPLSLVLWPIALLLVPPGLLFHGLAALGVRTFAAAFGRRIVRDLRARPGDETLEADLATALAVADEPEAPAGDEPAPA